MQDQKAAPRRFAMVGAAGFVAPRHMKAIHETGNVLVAACDPYDGVGVIDRYFPECRFFTEVERFDRHLEDRPSLLEAIFTEKTRKARRLRSPLP